MASVTNQRHEQKFTSKILQVGWGRKKSQNFVQIRSLCWVRETPCRELQKIGTEKN